MSVQHRPDRPSPWVARVRTPDGRQISRSFTRKIDAEAWEAEQRIDMRRGAWVDPRRGELTWDAYLEEVLATKVHLEPRTIETYQAAAGRVEPWLTGVPLNRITSERLDRVVAELFKSYAPETVAKSVRLIRMVLGRAVVHQRLVASPAANLEAPSPRKREMRILTTDEVELIADALPDRYSSLAVVGAWTGLRFGELAGLQVGAVDMLRRRLAVRQAVKEPRGRAPYVGPLKSKASARTLTLSRSVVDVLAAHLAMHPTVGFIWTTERGNLLRRGSFSRIWLRAVDETVGRPCRVHDLRHTHAAWLIRQGEHPKAIQDRLGHGSISVTLDRYGHLMDGLDEALADRLDTAHAERDVQQMWDEPGTVTDLGS